MIQSAQSMKYYLFYQIINYYQIDNLSYINKIFYYICISQSVEINKAIIKLNRLYNFRNVFITCNILIDFILTLYLYINYQLMYLYILIGYLLIFQAVTIGILCFLYVYKTKRLINICFKYIKNF